ncbi:MAG: hypothetical protein LH702_19550 [Phormidesmis sp. CAN_BIN44]|nr:hypothetical protein [Phormidesmis sp. CAN_BIN44]
MKSLLSTARIVLAACLCAVLMFSFAMPTRMASAVPMKNQPIKGEASDTAKTYERTAKDAIDQGGPQGIKAIEERVKDGGLNEIQGTAGIESMNRPSNSQGTGSIEKTLKKSLEKAEGKAGDAVKSARDSMR